MVQIHYCVLWRTPAPSERSIPAALFRESGCQENRQLSPLLLGVMARTSGIRTAAARLVVGLVVLIETLSKNCR